MYIFKILYPKITNINTLVNIVPDISLFIPCKILYKRHHVFIF